MQSKKINLYHIFKYIYTRRLEPSLGYGDIQPGRHLRRPRRTIPTHELSGPASLVAVIMSGREILEFVTPANQALHFARYPRRSIVPPSDV